MLFCNPSGIPSQISLSKNRVKRPDNRQHDEEDQKHPKDTDLKLRGHILLDLLIIEVVINDGKSLMKNGQILSVGQQADFPEDPLGQHRICRGEEVLGGGGVFHTTESSCCCRELGLGSNKPLFEDRSRRGWVPRGPRQVYCSAIQVMRGSSPKSMTH